MPDTANRHELQSATGNEKRLVEGEGLTTQNAATRRGVQQAEDAKNQANVSMIVPSISSEALATLVPSST